jgi:methionyl-tRNA formyltransferase
MRLVFAGTPQFAAVSLAALLQHGHHVVLVLTQPDRPSGRGLNSMQSPVKVLAEAHNIALQQPATLRALTVQQALRAWPAEAWVVAAYGLLLPPPILELAPLGCINVHASLLPRWRGAAPIQRAILAGDPLSGVSIMRMDAGLDTGPVFLRRSVPIDPAETAGSLHDRLAQQGAQALCEVLDQLAAGGACAEPQGEAGACYAHKITRADARIDWTRPATEIERLLRALDPVPGAFTDRGGETLKLWRGYVGPGRAGSEPGTVLQTGPEGIEVQCGDGSSLRVTVLQRPGGRRLAAAEFLRGHRFEPGTLLGGG